MATTARRPVLSVEALEAREVPAITQLFDALPPIPGIEVATDLHEDGDQICVTVRDTDGGAPVLISLVVFNRSVPNAGEDDQAFFSMSQGFLTAGGELTLCTLLPDCGLYQADVFVGPNATGTEVNNLPYWNTPNTQAALGNLGGTGECRADFDPRTQGYWKNHEEAWPVDSLTLGSITYTQAQLLDILRTPVRGNGAISLAHQLIAAKLNVISGSNPSLAVLDAMAAADAMLVGINLLGGGSLSTSQTSSLVGALDAFNNS